MKGVMQENFIQGRKVYHVCNISDKVIFRDEEDYMMAVNRLATCSLYSDSVVICYNIMSTHFHVVIATNHIKSFILQYRRNIAIRYKKRYGLSISLKCSFRELKNGPEIMVASNYVLKNSVHHEICNTPFLYPYSSINAYFAGELNRTSYKRCESRLYYFQKSNELSKRDYRRLFGSRIVPDNFTVMSSEAVIPESFVDVKQMEVIYKTAKNFLFQVCKPLKEELEMFCQYNNSFEDRMSLTVLRNNLTDQEACKLIDSIIAPRLFSDLSSNELEDLFSRIKDKGVNIYQFRRCT